MAMPGDWEFHAELEAELLAAQLQHPNQGPMHGWIEPDDDPVPPPQGIGGGYVLPPGFLDPLPLHPLDPYNPPANEEEEEEEEEDPEEDDIDAPGMEIDEESEEEEEEMEDQDPEEHDDKGPEYETDDGEEFIVNNRNYPVRSMNDPTVPVSHRTLRTPGGGLWRRTPRKQVPQVSMIRIQLPSQTATGKAKSQPWKPQGLSIAETGESSRPSGNDHSASTKADLEKRVTFLETQLTMAMRRMERMSEQNHITGMQVRVLEEGREVDHLTIETIMTDLVDARNRLTDVETRIAGLQEQIDATNTLALRAEGSSVEAIQGVENLQDMIEGRHGFW